MRELLDGVPLSLRDAKELVQLPYRHEDGEANHEPIHHWLREELSDKAEPHHGGDPEERSYHEHERGGGRRVGCAPRGTPTLATVAASSTAVAEVAPTERWRDVPKKA